MNNKTKIGKEKEDIAVEYLKNKGYQIIARNFKSRFGEIDIIAKDKNTIVIVEVRSKSYDSFGYPQETITKSKIEKIIKTTYQFLSKNDIYFEELRFDVIAILKDNILHIENAFEIR